MTTISPRPMFGTTSPALIRWTSLSGPVKRMPIWASLARTQTGAERQQCEAGGPSRAIASAILISELINPSRFYQRESSAPWALIYQGAVAQRSGAGRVFKGLGVAKRYCRINVISDTFLHHKFRPAYPI